MDLKRNIGTVEIAIGSARLDAKSAHVDRRVRLVADLLECGAFGCPVQLTQLAAKVNISSSHLRHLFTKELGMSPAKFVKLLRMEKAKELFETTFLSAKQVMYLVGFNDPSHFVRDYKIAFGESPSQTRASSARNLMSA